MSIDAVCDPGPAPTNPAVTVPLLRTKFITSRGGARDKGEEPQTVPLVPLSAMLTEHYPTDAHFAAHVTSLPHRLRNDDIASGDVSVWVGALVLDVDGAGHKANDVWWEAERAKVLDLLEEHPGAFIYRTKGGYRIVYLTSRPWRIIDAADDWAFACYYAAACRYLARRFAISADTSCGQWTRLFRAPHATREPSGGPELRETIGDPRSIGTWSCELTLEDMTAAETDTAPADVPRMKGCRNAGAAATDFAAAVDRFNRDQRAGQPKDHAPCPICRYKGGFGVDGDGKWFCFNDDHHASGKRHRDGWHGDMLDIAAWQRGITRQQVLLADGYLKATSMHDATSFESARGDVPPLDGVPPAPPLDVRPEIVISLELADVVDQAERAIATDPDVYQRGGRLARVVFTDSPLRQLRLQEPAPRVETLPRVSLRERLSSCATFISIKEKKDGSKERHRVLPPHDVVDTLDARGTWTAVRLLEALVDAPVLRPDGSIFDVPGYDSMTGLLLRPSGAFLPVPKSPTRADALAARDELLEVVADFDFAAPMHTSAWLAALLTPFARFAYDGPTPLFLIDSNVRGAGKGLLVDTVAIPTTGRCAPVTPLPPDDAEMSKTISSVLLAGLPMLVFDNVGGDLGSPALDLLLTSRTYSARVLGKSEMSAELPAHTLLFATGNNVQIRADTARRILRVRLDSKHERPEDRQGFKHPDLREWVRAERPRLVRAALTVLRAFCVAGRPALGLRAWGSFEQWSELVRGAVAWLGCEDAGETRIELAEEADTESHGLGRLLDALDQANLSQGFTVSALMQRAYGDSHDPVAHALREALEELCPMQPGRPVSSKSLGRRLLSFRRRIIDGRMLDRHEGKTRTGTVSWLVREAEQAAA
jgi:hypothetical protein